MTDNISFTIPLTKSAIARAIEMLTGLSSDIESIIVHKTTAVGSSTTIHPDIAHLDESDEFDQTVAKIESGKGASEPAPAADLELDPRGLPHDIRINNKDRKRLANGNWKYIRGVDKALIAEVETELHAMVAGLSKASATSIEDTTQAENNAGNKAPAPPPITEAPPPPIESTEPVKYITTDGGSWTREQLIASGYKDAQIDALPIADPPAPDAAMSFPELMAKITPALAGGTLTNERVLEVCADPKHNLDSLVLLSAKPHLIASVHADLFGA